MQGHTHEMSALTAAVYAVPVVIGTIPSVSESELLITTCSSLLSACIGGLLPDADTPNSTIRHKIFILA